MGFEFQPPSPDASIPADDPERFLEQNKRIATERVEDENGMTDAERKAYLRPEMSENERNAAIHRFKQQMQKEV